jgi:hypothetical protein
MLYTKKAREKGCSVAMLYTEKAREKERFRVPQHVKLQLEYLPLGRLKQNESTAYNETNVQGMTITQVPASSQHCLTARTPKACLQK